MSEVTELIAAAKAGDRVASERLLPLVYDELRKLAASKLAKEKPGQTLQATALVHEAYLRLMQPVEGGVPAEQWDGIGHFFSAAAEAMRRILIEQARRKASARHGGGARRVPLEDVEITMPESQVDLLELDEALTLLAEKDPLAADLVKLRFFAGLTVDMAAQALNISPRTAAYTWAYARAWLYRRIGP